MNNPFQAAIAKLAPFQPVFIETETYEGIRWPEGFMSPSKEEFEAELARQQNPTPQEVWAGAMMRALSALDILEQIDSIVAASGDLLMKMLWDRAAAFRRDDPMIAAVGATAGWSESDLDDLFRLAGSFNS